MKIYGTTDFNNSLLQKLVLDIETNFPTSPTLGRVVFKDKRLYICVQLQSGIPFWCPLTNEIDTYLHAQTEQATVWNVVHNLGTTTPLVQVYTATGTMVIPDSVTMVNNNALNISFEQGMTGQAIIMYGSIVGNNKPVYSFTYYQTSPSDTWVVNHGLGYEPIVRVFIGNEEVQPASIVHNTVNQATITFSSATTGIARFI